MTKLERLMQRFHGQTTELWSEVQAALGRCRHQPTRRRLVELMYFLGQSIDKATPFLKPAFTKPERQIKLSAAEDDVTVSPCEGDSTTPPDTAAG